MLSPVQKFINVSELRRNLSKYLNQSATDPVVVLAGKSKGSRVILDSKLYNELIEAYEDYQDAETLKTLVEEKEETVSWSQIKESKG